MLQLVLVVSGKSAALTNAGSKIGIAGAARTIVY